MGLSAHALHTQCKAFALLTLAASLLTIKAHADAPEAFRRYLGNVHPLLVLAGLSLLGLFLLRSLMKGGDFAVYRTGREPKGILLASSAAVGLAFVAIFVDMKVPFPKDMNVAFPSSIYFYPAIGYIVELAFHVVPFGLVYLLLSQLFGNPFDMYSHGSCAVWIRGPHWIVRASILPAAIIEPMFQVVNVGRDSIGVAIFVGLHLLVISLLQLGFFMRYDFFSMYAFRLAYYLVWHILWGHVRLRILF